MSLPGDIREKWIKHAKQNNVIKWRDMMEKQREL